MKSLSPYLVKFSGLKEGVHLFDFEIGNKFFKNFDYYDFADAKNRTLIRVGVLLKKKGFINPNFVVCNNLRNKEKILSMIQAL